MLIDAFFGHDLVESMEFGPSPLHMWLVPRYYTISIRAIYLYLQLTRCIVLFFHATKEMSAFKTFSQTILTSVPAVVFQEGGLFSGQQRSVYLSTTEVNLHFSASPEAVSCSAEPRPRPLLHHRDISIALPTGTPATITTASCFFISVYSCTAFQYQSVTANLCVIHHYCFLFIFSRFQSPTSFPLFLYSFL